VRPDKLLLQDILESIGEILDATPATQADFDADKFRSAFILRHIQIISEASWRLSQPLKARHPQVPWHKIAGMRHVLVHDYFEVNWQRVYETARDHVPALKPQIEAILASFLSDPGPRTTTPGIRSDDSRQRQLSLGLTLVTNNVREFRRVVGLPIKYWLAA